MRRLFAPALAATLVLAACDQSPTQSAATASDTDYALVMFGEAGSALEGTMGPQGPRPFDGRTYRRPFPDSLRLTEEQLAEIAALREAFRTEHAEELDALRAIFEEARAAREAGASREEIRAILEEGRPIALALRIDLVDLHYAIWSVFTDAQKAWVLSHRPLRMQRPMVPR